MCYWWRRGEYSPLPCGSPFGPRIKHAFKFVPDEFVELLREFSSAQPLPINKPLKKLRGLFIWWRRGELFGTSCASPLWGDDRKRHLQNRSRRFCEPVTRIRNLTTTTNKKGHPNNRVALVIGGGGGN